MAETLDNLQAGDAFSQEPEAILGRLQVTAENGLSETEARHRLAQFGPNQIETRGKASALAILLHQLANPVVYLLAAAAVLALVFGQRLEGSAVLVVLIINTLIGYFTEIKATRSMEALRTLGTRSARVRREGRMEVIPAEQLVPGDIVLVEGGDIISADMRIVAAANLAANESTLTGESVPVEKAVDTKPEDTRLAERANMLFKGTSITRGNATGVVVATGLQTELGRISQLVEEARPERSPLEKRLSQIAGQLVWLTIILTALIVGIGLLRDVDPMLMVTTGIALAVAAIPEGLPVVATLSLAQGMWRMARKNALIERLSAVETFGSTTLILTDKTGTLTENRMTVQTVCLPAPQLRPAQFDGKREQSPLLENLLRIGALCNAGELDVGSDKGVGDPMEVALLRAAARAGLQREPLLAETPLLREHPFDSAIRMMATVHQQAEGCLYAVKGAPEEVLARCSHVRHVSGDQDLDAQEVGEWRELVDRLASEGLRVIAIATKANASCDEKPFEGLVLLGIIGLRDPARANVAEAIADCHQAGIKVAIVTGDHAVTAVSIGRQVGLPVDASKALEGHSLARMDFEGPQLRSTSIFARVNPDEKLKLVRAFQEAGEVVAMTGDGVNDAPALRQADIGVAMGKRGTDVARQAAAMVLLDDAFPTIVTAIREGRIIFENIRRFAAYLLSCNLSEVLVVGMAVLFALPLPILPLQILFLNLVTDVFPAFALATAKGDDGIMKRPPRPSGENLLGTPQWRRIILHGFALTGATFASMAIGTDVLGLDGSALVTVTFMTLAFSQLFHVFNMRPTGASLLRNDVVRSPWVWGAVGLCTVLLLIAAYQPTLAGILGLVPPTVEMWATILGVSLAPLVLLQSSRLLLEWYRKGARA
ncbi:cation-transporting P-type ATPase [Aurantiacibacter sp. MUD11]|uniref:cation-translocating P-type ATPase n=1 Tax=Aurantiacibacter sp. MUD11 TaxID=3003265 RepID=UPI0022AAEAD7|nr:cation-transporting P-type ATPase [Aurantiacibacter sp. MUD11]WAT18925.1 cation-transporting P-type ATPase [Aurantiacibacter sp. MUD11]